MVDVALIAGGVLVIVGVVALASILAQRAARARPLESALATDLRPHLADDLATVDD